MIIHTPDDKNSQYRRKQAYKMQQNEIDALIVSYLMDEIGEDELAKLKKWAGESESNVSYFDNMKELWISAISESEKEKYDASRGYDRFKERVNTSQQRRKHHRSKYLYPFITCCAVCAILFFIGKAIYPNSTKTLQYFYVQSPIASTASFTLPDGSSVRLNAGSRLTYDSKFGKKERLVRLEGEAYFDVQHDERKTFIVETDRLRVTDIGTSFNVKDYPDDKQAEIALVQGKVSLSTSENENSLEMTPGEIAFVEKSSGKTTIRKGGIESAISWISGCYLFEDESLESIAKKLERGFNVNIVIKNKNANNLKFNGYFENGSDGIDKILYTLSQTGKINYSKQNGIYYIY